MMLFLNCISTLSPSGRLHHWTFFFKFSPSSSKHILLPNSCSLQEKAHLMPQSLFELNRCFFPVKGFVFFILVEPEPKVAQTSKSKRSLLRAGFPRRDAKSGSSPCQSKAAKKDGVQLTQPHRRVESEQMVHEAKETSLAPGNKNPWSYSDFA